VVGMIEIEYFLSSYQ